MVPAKIEIRSFSGVSNAEVLSIAGINSGATYISINAREVEQQLSRYYLVESAKVVKRFPDRLSIFLEPRQAVAMTVAMVNGRTQAVYFDRHGVVFRVGNGVGSAPAWIPIVSGILDDNQPVKLGMTLSSAYLPLLSRIGTISDEDPKIWQAISELGIAGKRNNLFDLVLYPVNDSIRLRMKSEISKESIHYALLMLDAYRKLGVAVSNEIDVRSGIGVVNVKEALFGK
jgi:cell division protein FtsQ